MSFADERRAIESRLSSQYAGKIKFENVAFSRPSTPWIALSILPTDSNQITLGTGSQVHRHNGLIVVQVFVPEDSGTNAARQIADQVDEIFRNAQFSYGQSGLIRCRVPRIDPVGVNEGWFQLNVTVEYSRDRIV